ncbi:iron dicitrate transporter FecR [Azorhizobium oxalatiphilum]|uniref:Iron dicitrate transporter FecR n=2 Tax=Azorhizobium oxalatiphilum TaxID=980631 RepID=A0A917BQZ2_9HYPH|nr:iron dicitrate transporter FecR [Azorhizobium oxalatiphilum]
MRQPEPDEADLIDEAIDLAIRLQSAPDNPVAQERVRVWRARGPAHEAAWLRVARVHGAAGKVLSDQRRAERHGNAGLSRRTMVLGGLVGLGAAATGAMVVPDLMRRAGADHVTAKGEVRRVALPDGGGVTLGPDSAVALDFGASRRGVRLLDGMAFFDVARDAERPFSVAAGDLILTTAAGALDVSTDAGRIGVALAQGAAEVHLGAAELPGGARLRPGDWLAFDTSSRTTERGRRDAGQIASWREGLVVAEHDSVGTLAARIGRWLPGRIVITDQEISNARVSGVFDLSDPLAALEAVVQPTGARVRQVASLVTIVSHL